MQNQSGAWHFLTGEAPQIKAVTSAAGFFYKWDEQTQQFAHVSGVLVITPDGRLSRYFYGIEYSPKELRLALVESGQGHIGSLVDELLLYCYHYDPANGRYGAVVMNLVRLGGVADGRAAGDVHRPDAAARDAPAAWRATRNCSYAVLDFRCSPTQASTLAPEIDNLYLGVLAITAFFAIIVVVVRHLFRDQVPRPHRRQGGRADYRLDAARARLVAHPVLHLDRHLRLGVGRLLPPRPAHRIRRSTSIRPASDGCGASSTSTASARSTSCTCRSGAPCSVVFTSEDVLHDLFIPAFRVKADAVPGRYSAIWFEATKIGEYHLFCAEYCGTKHSGMIGTVYVMEPADYQAWLAGGGAIDSGGTHGRSGASSCSPSSRA